MCIRDSNQAGLHASYQCRVSVAKRLYKQGTQMIIKALFNEGNKGFLATNFFIQLLWFFSLCKFASRPEKSWRFFSPEICSEFARPVCASVHRVSRDSLQEWGNSSIAGTLHSFRVGSKQIFVLISSPSLLYTSASLRQFESRLHKYKSIVRVYFASYAC